MCCTGFIKRVIPFFLTFAVGLFIASFFISITAPTFQFRNRGRERHQQYDRQLETDNQRLREENNRLKRQSTDKEMTDFSASDLKYLDVPPVPPSAPRRMR